jgi:hypothetical protein
MRTTLITALIFVSASQIHANEIVWHKGSVVLWNNEVVVGEIARQSLELLLLRNTEGITVLPAHKVSSFRYYDEKVNVNRMFMSAVGRYYERIVFGRICVLRIQKMFHQEISEKHAEQYDLYILADKTISPIKNFRNKYFDRIRDELDLRLVSHKHLDPNTRHGAVSLIILYNKATVPAI